MSGLLGSAIWVMCMAEVPVFNYYSDIVPSKISPHQVLLICNMVLTTRFLLYAFAVPREHVEYVLLVEPLHGITYAAMWCSTVLFSIDIGIVAN